MEFDLTATPLQDPVLPPNYRWAAWHKSLIGRHAEVKFLSFRDEIDSLVFPSLAGTDGCQRLMRDISRQTTFVPRATWLITYHSDDPWDYPEDCATIQGLSREEDGLGAVQNVGVVPEHRGVGLGRALMLQSLHGFRRAGKKRVSLEVTADNRPAVALYRSLGFRLTRTLYRPMPAAAAFSY